MLHVVRASALGPLADALAGILAQTPPDPLAPDWVAVPTGAMQRWLALRLARTLGATPAAPPGPAQPLPLPLPLPLRMPSTVTGAPPGGDGVTANVALAFPGALRAAVLHGERGTGEPDPWQPERLVWAVLDVLDGAGGDDRLGPVTRLPDGATRFGRARRLADLFDRYATHRPAMVASWHAGHDVDATGRAIGAAQRWQPHLWRLVRERVGSASPPERLPDLLAALRAGDLAVDLPPRLAVFGITTLPGGAPFVDLLHAVAACRELHVLLLDPSPAAARAVAAASQRAPGSPAPLRGEDASASSVRHPLLRSWGRAWRERTVLLAAAPAPAAPAPAPPAAGAPPAAAAPTPASAMPPGRSQVRTDGAGTTGPVTGPDDAPAGRGPAMPTSVLARLQHDIRADALPAGDLVPDPGDRSVQLHSCHGPERQVEVLRDAILHLLADDPTLREDDVVVLCPDVARFGPLVAGGFGPSVDEPGQPPPSSPPRLRYRVTDRSLRQASPVLGALAALLDLLAGRCTATEVLAFAGLAPVRRRFDLDDDALRATAEWTVGADVRWGIDGPHRAAWDVPAAVEQHTWRFGVDRVLLGVAVGDDDLGVAVGGIAPLGVEGGDMAVAGRVADLVARLGTLVADAVRPRPVHAWCRTLADAARDLFAVDPADAWQRQQLDRLLAQIEGEAAVGGEPARPALTLADMRRLLGDRLQGSPGRSDVFRGGIVVGSLAALRAVPFRVVCLLGLDETATAGAGTGDGDDLVAAAACVGDRDERAEVRQALLDAVLAAGDHLIATRTGHDVRTNQDVPPAVVYAELHDAVLATLAPAARPARGVEIVHPFQPFDARCLVPGGIAGHRPWSFDPGALAAARARARRAVPVPAPPFPPTGDGDDPGVVTLGELARFLAHPVRAFLRERLGLHVAADGHGPADDLPTALDPLARWAAAQRLIAARAAGRNDADWERHERALGTLPPGGLGDSAVAAVHAQVGRLLARAAAIGVTAGPGAERHPVDVVLADGTRVVGEVEGRLPPGTPGPASVTFSSPRPDHHLGAWLPLVALAATDPAPAWRSVVVRPSGRPGSAEVVDLVVAGASAAERRDAATTGLSVAVDVYRRARTEPLPLFPRLSVALHERRAGAGDWAPFGRPGDADDEAHVIAFGRLTFDEVRALAVQPHDPPGPAADRATRYADHLWGTVLATTAPTPARVAGAATPTTPTTPDAGRT